MGYPQVIAESVRFLLDRVGLKPTAGRDSQEAILATRWRFGLTAGGEQGGKSVSASQVFFDRHVGDLDRAREAGDVALYWLVGHTYPDTSKEFGYITDGLTELYGEAYVKGSKNVDPGWIEYKKPGARKPYLRVETKSADKPRALSRDAPYGIIACEASQLDLVIFERMNGRCAPKNAWLYMSGTFEEGSIGWFPQTFEAWKAPGGDHQSFSLPSWSNPHLYPGGRNDPEILRLESESSDEYFLERISGIPVPPKGLVFRFRPDIHVREIEWEPGEPVHLAVDPGHDSAHAVAAIQVIGGQVRVFDMIYEKLITEDVIQIVKQRPWLRDVRFGAIDDSYGHQQHAGGRGTPAELWGKSESDGGIGLYMASNPIRINDADERLRGFLKPDPLMGEPRIVFSPRCRGILSEFGTTPNPFDGLTRVYKWRTDKDGNIVGDIPENKNNHGIRAVEFFLVQEYGWGYVRGSRQIQVKQWRQARRKSR